MTFYILRHQMMHYPTVNGNANLELFSTPQYKIRNFSYEFAVFGKNKIPSEFSPLCLFDFLLLLLLIFKKDTNCI